MYKGTKESDKKLEELWIELGNISIDDEDCIMQDFYQFDAGTYRLAIWKWFDEQYSKGVASLLYPQKIDDIKDEVYVLMYSTDHNTDVIGVFTTRQLGEESLFKHKSKAHLYNFDPKDYLLQKYELNVTH